MSEKKNFQEEAKPSSSFGLLGLASTMGMHMISGPVVGGGLGWLIDRWLDSSPWALGAGVLLGIVAGFRNVWADAERLRHGQEEIDAQKAAESEEALQRLKDDPSRTRVEKKSFAAQKGDELSHLEPDEDDFWLLDRPERKEAPDMAQLQDEYRELVQELRQENSLPQKGEGVNTPPDTEEKKQ